MCKFTSFSLLVTSIELLIMQRQKLIFKWSIIYLIFSFKFWFVTKLTLDSIIILLHILNFLAFSVLLHMLKVKLNHRKHYFFDFLGLNIVKWIFTMHKTTPVKHMNKIRLFLTWIIRPFIICNESKYIEVKWQIQGTLHS